MNRANLLYRNLSILWKNDFSTFLVITPKPTFILFINPIFHLAKKSDFQ